MLERLRGAASASEPRTQKAIYDLGFSVMNHILVFLEVYKHEVAFTFIIILNLYNILDALDRSVIYMTYTFVKHLILSKSPIFLVRFIPYNYLILFIQFDKCVKISKFLTSCYSVLICIYCLVCSCLPAT